MRLAQTTSIIESPFTWLRLPLELRTDSLRRPSSGAAAIRFAAELKLARSLAWCRAGKALAAPGIEFVGRCSPAVPSRGTAARAACESLKREANGVRRTPTHHLCSRVPQVTEQHYQLLNLFDQLTRPRRAEQMRARQLHIFLKCDEFFESCRRAHIGEMLSTRCV